MKESVLVVGADGLVGRALFNAFQATCEAVGTSRRAHSSHLMLDLANGGAEVPKLDGISLAFLCAAATSLKRCRENPAETRQINVDNTVALAGKLVSAGVRVVFFSTALVFDGKKPFCREADSPNPQCEYGRQKLDAERALLSFGDAAAVVRLTKVIAPEVPLFRHWREDLLAGRAIHPFTDYRMSPISVSIVVAVMQALRRRWLSGLLHLSADRDMDYGEAAMQFAKRLDPSLALLNLVQPTTSAAAGADLEVNPRFTTLDTSRLRCELNLVTPSADASLAECFQSLSA